MIRKIIFILVGCLVALSSCQWDGKSGNTADVDVRVARYDRLQYEYVTMNSFSALQKMNTDYPQVTKLLIEDVLAIGEVDDMKINDRMLEYYSDSTLLTLMHDAEEKFKEYLHLPDKLPYKAWNSPAMYGENESEPFILFLSMYTRRQRTVPTCLSIPTSSSLR